MQQQQVPHYPLYQRDPAASSQVPGMQPSKRDAAAAAAAMQASMQQGVRREPPPYPGPARSFQNAGYRQSYASSETGSTDLSLSSCENLCTSLRQDPQGSEETASLLSNPRDACRPISGGGGYNVMLAQQQQQQQSGVEVKSANSSTFYVTGNMPAQSDDVSMTSYTALPQMSYGQSQGAAPAFAPAPMYNRQSLPPGAPGTPDPMAQMGLYSQPSSAPSTPDRMHSNSPFLNTQHQQQLYSNQYYNSNVGPINQNSGLAAPMGQQQPLQNAQQQLSQSLPSNNARAQLPIMQQQQQQTGDGNYANFTTTPLSDTHSNQAPSSSLRHGNSQLKNQHLEDSHQCNQKSQSKSAYANQVQNVPQEQLLDSHSKHDPYRKWRHFYVNQKTQLSQYKLLNQLTDGQLPEGQNLDQIADNKENMNLSPIKLAKSKSGSQIATGEGKVHLENCVSNVRATDRLRSATPDMMSERPSVSRQLPMRPSSANAVAKQQRNNNNNQDLRHLSFMKQQQHMKLAKSSSHKNQHTSFLNQSATGAKKPNPSSSSNSTKDDVMSTISTISTTSNMSTSSSEMETNKSRAINRQRSASGGNPRHSNINNLTSGGGGKLSGNGGNNKLSPSAKTPASPSAPKSMSYPSGSYLNYMPEAHQHKHLQHSPKPSSKKSATKSSLSSSKSSPPSAFKAALHKFTGGSSEKAIEHFLSRQCSSDSNGAEQSCAGGGGGGDEEAQVALHQQGVINAQLSRNLAQSRSASRLPRPRTAPPQRSEKMLQQLQHESHHSPHQYRKETKASEEKNLQFHAFDMDSPVADNKLSSNKKEFSRSCEMLNQLIASQQAQHQHNFQGYSQPQQGHANNPLGHLPGHRELLFKGQGQEQQPDSTQAGDDSSPPLLGALQGQGDSEGRSPSSHYRKSSPSSVQQPPGVALEPGQDNRNKLGVVNNGEVDHAAIATRATQMVERLSAENHTLRADLERQQAKVAKLQKFEVELQKVSEDYQSLVHVCWQFEVELQKVSEDYQSLVQHSQTQENLEKVMRFKLGCEIKKLKDHNTQLKDHVISHDGSPYSKASDTDMKRELKEKDGMLTKLISQNRELSKNKDRVEIELAGETVRNEERLKQVNALEKALKSTQAQVFKLEEEVGRLKIRETKIEQLQSALSQLRTATEKRELIEQKLRQKLEEEIRLLKHHKSGKGGSKASDTDEGISSDSECPTRVHTLMRQMAERDQQLLKLESQVAHWEQKFYEEGALRILAVDAASVPKDARIAALEMSSQDTERLIEESRTDRLRNLEEVYRAKKSTAELEARVKTLELQLAERDAMVRILNRPNMSSLSRTSSQNSLFSPSSPPLHSPLPTISPLPVTSPLAAHPSATCAATVSGAQSGVTTSTVTVSSPLTPQLPHRDVSKLIAHAKSNSEGAVLDLSSMATTLGGNSSQATVTTDAQPKHDKLEPTLKDLQKKLVAQAAIFQNWQKEEPGDIKKELYQV